MSAIERQHAIDIRDGQREERADVLARRCGRRGRRTGNGEEDETRDDGAHATQHSRTRPRGSQPVQTHGFFKSGFVVDDIDAEYARLKGLNVTLAYDLGQPPGGPYRSFGVRDPEGNLLQYFGK